MSDKWDRIARREFDKLDERTKREWADFRDEVMNRKEGE